MEPAVLLLLAAFTGLATADMFVRAWTGLMRAMSALVLFLRGAIDRHRFLSRLHGAVLLTLLCGLTLMLCFQLYCRTYGLGRSQGEQVAYFLAAVARTIFFLKDVGALVDEMFSPGDDDPI